MTSNAAASPATKAPQRGSSAGSSARLYVWVWLPGATDPVPAGAIEPTGASLEGEPVIAFTYARSYRERKDAIALFPPELPLGTGTINPTRPGVAVRDLRGQPWLGLPRPQDRSAVPLAGCLRDAAPDAWGRRVINLRLAADPEAYLTEMTYLQSSSSDRIGALDFQSSPSTYEPRGESATLEQLINAAALVEAGEPIPEELAAAAGHGTSIGGARPKAILSDDGPGVIAKFSSSTDTRPVVKAEAVGMLLAGRVGIEVPRVQIVHAAGKDVLLVDRFDRTANGGRRLMVSALTILGLRAHEARYAGYPDLVQSIRSAGWSDVRSQLQELYTRMVVNIAISNTDDHLRNHAAFWDGQSLRLTPAYDVSPQPRSTQVATHAIALTARGNKYSQFWVAKEAAVDFGLTTAQGQEVIDHVVESIHASWAEVCDEAHLTRAERDQLWGREILNPYASYPES
ncbi:MULTISPECIES: type II toxin-antitoxin system HipA family toxin [unclassified Modestobacter]|uniref:type II toxin-antitoxin system HipA family toxin n=1 Tax=unclassified Modestobacter TaxID=2643866 RepID=UPI0022AB52ED|nr:MULTISPECIES: HipA domain-containing protein [unclassified Modestobacter]